MKILHLTLKKVWFDLIASGEKVEEYRENKPYWKKRLTDEKAFLEFDEIHFKNGYSKEAPFMRVVPGKIFRDYRVLDGKEQFVFIIPLKEVLEVKNNDKC